MKLTKDLRCANFRIGLFHNTGYGKGIGSWAIEKTLEFAFEESLAYIELKLDVFSFKYSCNTYLWKNGI